MNNVLYYASIGKTNLIQALGLQKPYKEGKADTCTSCKFYNLLEPSEYGCQHDYCEACAMRKSMVENAGSNYVYEKNLYSINNEVRKKLSSAQEIHIYLLLHFLHATQSGVTDIVDENEMAQMLGVHVRTVKNNLKKLKKAGYIEYQKHPEQGRRAIAVRIKHYEEMYKPRVQGGKGYIIFSREMLAEFIKVKSINSLRIQLRIFIENDKDILLKDQPEEKPLIKSYREIRRYLPPYCKRNVIKKALSEHSNLLQFVFNKEDVIFTVEKKYNAGKRKKEQEAQYEEMMKDFLKALDREIEWDKDSLFKDEYKNPIEAKISSFLDTIKGEKPIYKYKGRDIKDFIVLCMEFGFSIVTESILKVYARYVTAGRDIGSMGALVRTFVENSLGILPEAT